jgi:hypothetical protein
MAAVDVDRMRRYVERTNAASRAASRGQADTLARARGEHCALCAGNPQIRALHAAFSPLAETFRTAFGGRP